MRVTSSLRASVSSSSSRGHWHSEGRLSLTKYQKKEDNQRILTTNSSTLANMTKTSSFQLLEDSILPHLLLPCANILALASPPFKGRGLLWSSLIAYLAYLTLVDDYPVDTGVRYGLTNLWFFYLPTIEKLLFSQPEQAYWRLDRQKAEAASMRFGFQKLKWATALWINPRGIGWNYQLKGVRPAKYSNSRWIFVSQQLFRSLLYYIVLATMSIYVVRYPYLGYRDSSTWTRSLLTELIAGIFIAFGWQLQWTIASVAGVASGLSQPKVSCPVVKYGSTRWNELPKMKIGLASSFRQVGGSHNSKVFLGFVLAPDPAKGESCLSNLITIHREQTYYLSPSPASVTP